MKTEIAVNDVVLESPVVAGRRPLKARRGVLPVATNKAWWVLLAAITMIILEGAFRKWVFPEGGLVKYLMYFSKDIIFAALLFFPKRSQPSLVLKTFEKWLLPGCALLVLGAIASSMEGFNLVGAVLTARAVIILPVLAWLVVPRLMGLPLRWVIWLLIGFTVLNFALGVVQNRLPADNILNRYSETGMDIVAVESGVRATGTFSYITGITILSAIGIWAGLALMSLAKTQWQRIGAWAAFAAGFGCGLASVSRAPIVIGAAMVAGWLVCSRAGVSTLAKGLVAAVFCVVIATGFGITPVFSELGQGLLQRSESGGDTFNERAFGQLDEMISALQSYPLGHGFGTEQIGGQYYSTGEAGFNHYESPFPRLVMETGAIGLVGYLIICAGALLALQRAKLDASAGTCGMLLATQLLFLPMFYGSLIFDHTASAFVWMLMAAVMAAKELKPEAGGQMPEGGGQQSERKSRRSERAPHSVTNRDQEDVAAD